MGKKVSSGRDPAGLDGGCEGRIGSIGARPAPANKRKEEVQSRVDRGEGRGGEIGKVLWWNDGLGKSGAHKKKLMGRRPVQCQEKD